MVKDLFISNMTNTSIQMDLVSEVRTSQQVLNFAINRERGQANQQEILRAQSSSTNWSKVSYIRNKPRTPFTQRPPQQPILPTPTTGKIEPCYKCGHPFIKKSLKHVQSSKLHLQNSQKDRSLYINVQSPNARTKKHNI